MKKFIATLICLLIAIPGYCASPGANKIKVSDTGDYYTGANVEAVLQEIGASGGAGGTTDDDVTVNSSAVDTTANIKDSTDITWTLGDGGAGGPDDISGAVVDDSHAHVYTNIDAFTEANLYTRLSDVTNFLQTGDALDGESITNDTIDDDSIDFTDVTLLDFGLATTHDTSTELDALYEGELDNEAGLYSALSDVTNFLQTGDALAGDDITDGSIDATELADNSVDSGELVNGGVDAGHLAADVIDETKIADNGIDSEHYNDDSIDDAHINFGCGANQVCADDIPIPVLDSPTYTTLEDAFNLFTSAGRITGGEVTDATSENVNVAAGTGVIRIADDDVSAVKFFDIPATNGIAITTDSVRYIVVDYNTGTEAITVTAWTTETWDKDTEFPLAKVVNDDGTLHILNNPWWTGDSITNMIERWQGYAYFSRDEHTKGLILSVSDETNREIAVTAGTIWSRLNEFSITALDTNVTGTFELYSYTSSAWGDSDVTAYPVTHWNDLTANAGAGGLTALTNNYYMNLWVYAEADDDDIAIIYGQAEYLKSADAEAEAPPSTISSHHSENAMLIGRIIIREGVNAPVQVDTVFGTVFTASQAADHGNLAGLSDDDHAAYENELDNSAGLLAALDDETGTGVAVFSTSPTLVTPTLGTINSGVGTALTALNGENIQDNTIDVDSLDWGAFTDLGESGAVTWGNIAEGELTDASVVTADIKADNITSALIADDQIDSEHYVAASIDNEHLADNAVDSAEINTNAVQLDALDVSDVSDNIAGDIAEGELADAIIVDADIKDDVIQEPALNVSNAPTDNYVLTYNLAGTNFTWVEAAGGGTMNSFFLEDDDGTEVEIDDTKEIKFIDSTGLTINWTDVTPGSDADPFDLTFTIVPADIAGAVAEGELANAIVVTADIKADNITEALIADDQIDSEHYVAASIDNEHLADNAVDSAEINTNAVKLDALDVSDVSDNIAADIAEGELTDACVVTADIKADNITSALIADDQIDSEHYIANSIDEEHMAVNSIDSDSYVDGSIDLAHMSSSSVDSDNIVDNTIANADMADNSIDSDDYVDGSIDAVHLAADIIDETKIADNGINSEHYNDGSVDAVHLAADTITNTQIADADQTVTMGIWFEDPTADDDFKSIWANKTANDFLITEIWAESDGDIDFDLQVDDGSPADVNGDDIEIEANEAEDTSMGGDATVAAGEELDLVITAVDDSPTWVSIQWTGNWVD